jgi:hypothetical protein
VATNLSASGVETVITPSAWSLRGMDISNRFNAGTKPVRVKIAGHVSMKPVR